MRYGVYLRHFIAALYYDTLLRQSHIVFNQGVG